MRCPCAAMLVRAEPGEPSEEFAGRHCATRSLLHRPILCFNPEDLLPMIRQEVRVRTVRRHVRHLQAPVVVDDAEEKLPGMALSLNSRVSSATEMRPQSNIQCAVPHSARPLRMLVIVLSAVVVESFERLSRQPRLRPGGHRPRCRGRLSGEYPISGDVLRHSFAGPRPEPRGGGRGGGKIRNGSVSISPAMYSIMVARLTRARSSQPQRWKGGGQPIRSSCRNTQRPSSSGR